MNFKIQDDKRILFKKLTAILPNTYLPILPCRLKENSNME